VKKGILKFDKDDPPIMFFGLCGCESCEKYSHVEASNLTSVTLGFVVKLGGSSIKQMTSICQLSLSILARNDSSEILLTVCLNACVILEF